MPRVDISSLDIVPVEARRAVLFDWAEVDASVIPTAGARVLGSTLLIMTDVIVLA